MTAETPTAPSVSDAEYLRSLRAEINQAVDDYGKKARERLCARKLHNLIEHGDLYLHLLKFPFKGDHAYLTEGALRRAKNVCGELTQDSLEARINTLVQEGGPDILNTIIGLDVPLTLAHSAETARTLIKLGADPNLRFPEGRVAKSYSHAVLHRALTPEVALVLLEAGADIVPKTTEPAPIVSYFYVDLWSRDPRCISNYDIAISLMFLLLGQDPDSTNTSGDRLLSHAIEQSGQATDPNHWFVRFLKALVEAGADRMCTANIHGRETILQKASKTGNPHVIAILESAPQPPSFKAAEELFADLIEPERVAKLLPEIARVKILLAERKAKATTDATRTKAAEAKHTARR